MNRHTSLYIKCIYTEITDMLLYKSPAKHVKSSEFIIGKFTYQS